MRLFRISSLLVTAGLFALTACANMNAVHDAAEASPQANIAIVGK